MNAEWCEFAVHHAQELPIGTIELKAHCHDWSNKKTNTQIEQLKTKRLSKHMPHQKVIIVLLDILSATD